MTKLSEVAPKPDQLKIGMALKITSVSFENKVFEDGKDTETAVIVSEGKHYWTSSQPIVDRLKSKAIQEFLSNNPKTPLECEVKEGGDKRKYMFLE